MRNTLDEHPGESVAREEQRGRLWAAVLAWAAILAVLSFGGVSHERERFLRSAAGRATLRLSLPRLVEEMRADLTNDGDLRRYLAYANAALGRPYLRYFVRTLEQWRAAAAAGEDADPDASGEAPEAAPLIPYRDYLVEYPPGFFLFALPLAAASRGPDSFATIFCGAMAITLSVALALCARLLRRAAPDVRRASLVGWSAAAVGALGVVATHRYDAAVALLLCASALAAAERRPALCGAALGLAVATKLAPAALVPVFVAFFVRERRALVRFLVAAPVAAALPLLPALLFAGRGLQDLLRYHAARPLQIESTAAALLGLARAAQPQAAHLVHGFGSQNLSGPLASPLGRASAAAGLCAFALALALCVRRQRAPGNEPPEAVLVDGMLATLLALLPFSKVLSPQYLVWLLPLALVAALRRRAGARLLLVGALLLTQVIYPYSNGALGRLEPWAFALVLLRNAMLAGLAALFALRPSCGARPRGQRKARIPSESGPRAE